MTTDANEQPRSLGRSTGAVLLGFVSVVVAATALPCGWLGGFLHGRRQAHS